MRHNPGVWRRGRRATDPLPAAVFADDLRKGCQDLFAVLGAPGDARLSLPITIPIDEGGQVLLRPEGPLDAPRVPATLDVTRPSEEIFGIRIERRDRGSLRIPGLHDARAGAPRDAELTLLACDVTKRGLAISGFGPDGPPVPLAFDETTARALATALLITIGMKLAKAGNR
jgi:hypothetical protein